MLGVRRGDRVGLLSQNSLEMVDLIGAVALLGAILLPVNFRLNADEIAFVLSDGGPVVIVAGAEYHEAIVALKGGRRRPSARRAAVAGWNAHCAEFSGASLETR